jgi:hypothetical protein
VYREESNIKRGKYAMVDLSKRADRPVDGSVAGFLNLEVAERTGNGQKTEVAVAGSANLSDYTGASIRILEGIEAIRLRPAMYIGMVCIT